MKSEAQVRQKLKQAVYRQLQKRLRANLEREPCNCQFYREVTLGDDVTVGLCVASWPEPEPERTCGSERAEVCPIFEPKMSKDTIRTVFSKFLHSANLTELHQAGLHDVALLLWVLGEDSVGDLNYEDLPPNPTDEPPQTVLSRLISYVLQ